MAGEFRGQSGGHHRRQPRHRSRDRGRFRRGRRADRYRSRRRTPIWRPPPRPSPRPVAPRRWRSRRTFASSKASSRCSTPVKDKFGRCDALVNSAGATKPAISSICRMKPGWTVMRSSSSAACGCAVVLADAEGGARLVVNISGGAARSPGADFSIGASVNAAMGNFSKGLSQRARRTASTSTSSIPARPKPNASTNCSSSARRHPAIGRSLKHEATAKDGIAGSASRRTSPR